MSTTKQQYQVAMAQIKLYESIEKRTDGQERELQSNKLIVESYQKVQDEKQKRQDDKIIQSDSTEPRHS